MTRPYETDKYEDGVINMESYKHSGGIISLIGEWLTDGSRVWSLEFRDGDGEPAIVEMASKEQANAAFDAIVAGAV